MTTLNDAQTLMDLFQGSDLAFGRADLTKKISQTGKHEARCWMEKRPVTEEDWRKHVEGIAGIGIPPINSESKCRFGAIDVDQYRGLSLEDLCRDIADSGIPLVVCRSKSGGPHIYLFVSDWISAGAMVEKMDMLAGYFGFGASEIFPKQVSLGSNGQGHPDYGNWINMPYFNGAKNFRYGLDSKGEALTKIQDFADYVRSRTITPEDFEKLAPPPSDDEIFPGGPPCLNHIFRKNKDLEGARNITLCNVAVYAKKAHPDNWKDKLDEYNRYLENPLPGRELEAIKKSYGSKDYRYMCRKSPLCDYCNSQVCKTQEHGVGDAEILPNNRSLTVINTSPPVWYLDIIANETEVQRISLSTDELQTPRLFQKRCMEVLKIMPPVPKNEEWTEIVQGLLKHCTEIDMPAELSPKGQLLEFLESFILDNRSTESPEDLLRGLVFCGPEDYWFRWKDFKNYLDRQRFDLLKQNQILAILRTEMNCIKDYQKIAGKGCNFWKIPRKAFASDPEPLTVKEVINPF